MFYVGGGCSNKYYSGFDGGSGVGGNGGGGNGVINTGSSGGGIGYTGGYVGSGGSGIVIIKYRYTIPTNPIGYLTYDNDMGWNLNDIVGDSNNKLINASNYILKTSNVTSTRITNLPQSGLTPDRFISDSYTRLEVDTKDTNNSNVISTRI